MEVEVGYSWILQSMRHSHVCRQMWVVSFKLNHKTFFNYFYAISPILFFLQIGHQITFFSHPNAMKLGYGSASIELLLGYFEAQFTSISEEDVQNESDSPRLKITKDVVKIRCHTPKPERRKRSRVDDFMYNIITMQSSKQATTSSIALIVIV
ncbi:uncharacterized protein LOC128127164 isoform X2 [Lactuca sativa]|nr:uncharacterized protein LOC128127164 isoform X2 [Lactuca sativa]